MKRLSLLLVALIVLALSPGVAAATTAPAGVGPLAPVVHGLGLKPAKRSATRLHFMAQAALLDTLPDHVDLTPWAMPPGDQGQVGSCATWAIAYTAMGYYENRYGIPTPGGGEAMYIYSQTHVDGDGGSYFSDDFNIAMTQGVDSRNDYSQGDFDWWDLPTAAESENAANWVLSGYTTLNLTQYDIENALAAGQPVAIGIPVTEAFEYNTSGVYPDPSNPDNDTTVLGFHGITALAYDQTGLTIENSWGPDWDNHGYVKIKWSWLANNLNEAYAVGSVTHPGPPPQNTAPPHISGSAVEGTSLTVTHGTWSNNPLSYSEQWQDCDALGAACSPIAGATGQSYTLSTADVGHTIRVQESASNVSGASSPTSSSATAVVVLPPPPTNISPPTISGIVNPGQTLTAARGTWSNNPTSYAYQWQDCDASGGACSAISAATGQSYTLATIDVGHTLRVQDTAANAAGAGDTSSSAATAIVVVPAAPTNLAPPGIVGTAQQGQILSESPASWSNNPVSYHYQWLACDASGANCSAITGATTPTHTLALTDTGHAIRVQETATNAGGTSAPASSAATGVVLPLPPSATSPPTIAGNDIEGQVLTEAHGTWANAPTSYTFTWEDCDASGANCTVDANATGQTYTLTGSDVLRTIRVQETASNSGGTGAPSISAATTVVVWPLAPKNTAPPSISGTPTQGQTLTESHGNWSNSPTSYSYQWEECDSQGNNCTAILFASNQTYTLMNFDAGHTIRVQETAHNGAGNASDPASSAATAVVLPLPPTNYAPPSISGTYTAQGQTLSETHGAWLNGVTAYAYQWEDCDGPNCKPIAGATAQTYTLTSGDVGHTITVQETAINAGGRSSPAAAIQTGAVTPPHPSNVSAPTISGTASQGQTLVEAHGTWTTNLTGYTYQWERCDTTGNNCIITLAAIAASYTLTSADVGHTMRVQESASNAYGWSKPATSAPTAVVVALPKKALLR